MNPRRENAAAPVPNSRIGAVILAAGRSSRMGSPKALLTYQDETFLARLVRVMGAACDPVVVVLGHHAETLRSHIPAPAHVAINPDPDRGQLSSLQTGLAALPQDLDGFAFIPVDCPSVMEETVRKMGQAFAARAPETLFVIPRMGSSLEGGGKGYRRGHPVLATRAVAAKLLALSPTDEARKVVHAHVDRTEYVSVADEGIFADIDDPANYRDLVSSLPAPAETEPKKLG